jgi:NitT/TauT family transport system permease protein
MAGGWFFLALSESFEISNQKYQLPGLGSFLSLSYQTQDYRSFMYGLATMALMIIGVDFVLWKPLTVWIGKFAESPNSAVAPKSLFVSLLQKADITDSLKKHLFNFKILHDASLSFLFKRRKLRIAQILK